MSTAKPTCRQLLRQIYLNLMGIKVEKPPQPRAVPHLFGSSTTLDPALARRIVMAVISQTEAAGGFIAVAILSIGGNPILCEKSLDLGEAFWQAAINHAKAIAHETSSQKETVREAAATLMHQGEAAGFVGVAGPAAELNKAAVTIARAELAQAVTERNQALAFNHELRRALAAKNPPKTCRACGRVIG